MKLDRLYGWLRGQVACLSQFLAQISNAVDCKQSVDVKLLTTRVPDGILIDSVAQIGHFFGKCASEPICEHRCGLEMLVVDGDKISGVKCNEVQSQPGVIPKDFEIR